MTYHLNVAPNGRLVLPADVRKRLGLSEGGDLLMEETSDGLVLAHRRAGGRPRAGDRASIYGE